jgi:hypothetical protein
VRPPLATRIGRSRVARSLFLALATLGAALGFPIKIEPPPPRKTPVETVRDEGDGDRRQDVR